MTLRRYSPMKPSRGTSWPRSVLQEIIDRDGWECIGPRLGMPGDCLGGIETDHVRASHGIGMKSPSVASNGLRLCGSHHRMKTENGRHWRPVFLVYLATFQHRAA